MLPLRSDSPTGTVPVVTCLLIVVNVAVFFYEVTAGDGAQAIVEAFGVIPAELFARPFAEAPTLISSMFLHAGLFHLIFNMWILFLFGDNVEYRLGRARFLGFYLAAGLAAGLLHAVIAPGSETPCIGASGAISGVMGAFALLYPNAGIKTLVTIVYVWRIVRLPALVYVGFWFIGQLFWGLAHLGSSEPGIAWWAHIGGCLTGVGVAIWILNKERLAGSTPRRTQRRTPPVRPKSPVVARPSPAARPPSHPRTHPAPPWADS